MKPLIGSLVLLASVNLFAAQSLSTKINGQYNSLRALGMGNAFGLQFRMSEMWREEAKKLLQEHEKEYHDRIIADTHVVKK